MKKIFNLLLIVALFVGVGLRANALTFEEAYNESNKKPMVALIYAQWAEDCQTYLNVFKTIQDEFSDNYNFVELDIASKDTKFFNSKYHIYPNLPYILMYRDGGKVSRYLPNSCAKDEACIITKLKSFAL